VLGLGVLGGLAWFLPNVLAHLAAGSGAGAPVVSHAEELAHAVLELTDGGSSCSLT